MADNGCCMEWEQEIVLYHDNELSHESCLRVEKHLNKCSRCSDFYVSMAREERFIAGRLRHRFTTPLSTRAFTDQIMRSLPAQPLSASERAVEWAKEYAEWMLASGRRSVALAMTLLICALGAYWTIQVGLHVEETILNVNRNGAIFRTTLFEPFFIDQDKGEYFELPDGSILYATQGTWFSIVSFPNDDESRLSIDGERRVNLVSGELFIDVQPRREAFSVVTSNAKVTVYGTQFYVETDRYSNTQKTTIAVRDGLVNVEKWGRNQIGATQINTRQMTHVTNVNSNSITLKAPEPIDPLLLERLDIFYEKKESMEAPLPLPVKESPIYQDNDLLQQMQSYTPPQSALEAANQAADDDKSWRILDDDN